MERGLGGHVKNLVSPVLAALGSGLLVFIIVESAMIAAVVAVIVFVVMMLRKGGSISGFKDWIDMKLSFFDRFGF